MGKSSYRTHKAEVPSLLTSVAGILENSVLGVFGAVNENVTSRGSFSRADHVLSEVEGNELTSTETVSDEAMTKTHPKNIIVSRSSSMSSDDMPELDRLGESTCNSSSGENTRSSGEVREAVRAVQLQRGSSIKDTSDFPSYGSEGSSSEVNGAAALTGTAQKTLPPFVSRWRNHGHSNSSALTLVPGMSPRSMREELGRESKGTIVTAPNSRMRSDSGFSPLQSSEIAARAELLEEGIESPSKSPTGSTKSSTTTLAVVPFPLDLDVLPKPKPPSRRTNASQASKSVILQGRALEQLVGMRKSEDSLLPVRGLQSREGGRPRSKEGGGGEEDGRAGSPTVEARRGLHLGPESYDHPRGEGANGTETKDETAKPRAPTIFEHVGPDGRPELNKDSQRETHEQQEASFRGVSRAPTWDGPDDGAIGSPPPLGPSDITQDRNGSASKTNPHFVHHFDQGTAERPSPLQGLWQSRSSSVTPGVPPPISPLEKAPSTLAEVAADIALRGSIASAELVPGLGRGAFERISISPSSGPVRVLATSVAMTNGGGTDVAGNPQRHKSSDKKTRKTSPNAVDSELRSRSHRTKSSRSRHHEVDLMAPKLTVVHAPGQVLKPIANQPQHGQYRRNGQARQSSGINAEHRLSFRLSSSTRLTSFGSRSTASPDGANNLKDDVKRKQGSRVTAMGAGEPEVEPQRPQRSPLSSQSPTIDVLSSFGSSSAHTLGVGGADHFQRRGSSGPARMERLESDNGEGESGEDDRYNVYRRHHSLGSSRTRCDTEQYVSYSTTRSKSCLYSRVSSHSVSRSVSRTISRSESHTRSRSGGSSGSSARRARGAGTKRRSSSLRKTRGQTTDEHGISADVHTRRTSSGSHSSMTHYSEHRRHSNRRSHRDEKYAKVRGQRRSRSRSNSGGGSRGKKSDTEHRRSRRSGSRSSSQGSRHTRHPRDHGRSESLRSSGSERTASFKGVRDREHSVMSEHGSVHSRNSTRSGGRRHRRRDLEPDGIEDGTPARHGRRHDSLEELNGPYLGSPAGSRRRSDSKRSRSKSHESMEGADGEKRPECLTEEIEGVISRREPRRKSSARGPARGHSRRGSEVSDHRRRGSSQLPSQCALEERDGNGDESRWIEDHKADEHDAPPSSLLGVPFGHSRKGSIGGRLGDPMKPRDTSDASSAHGDRRRDYDGKRTSNTYTGASVPATSARNTVIIHSPLVRNTKESRSFPYFWGSRKARGSNNIGGRPRSVPAIKSPVLVQPRTAFSEGTPIVEEQPSYEAPKAPDEPSRKFRRSAGSLGAQLVRMFGCSIKPRSTPRNGSKSGGILGRRKKRAKGNGKNRDDVGEGRVTSRQAALEARFGSGKTGRQLSQLYGYPASSIERTLATMEENSSHGADRLSASFHDGEDGGLRVQHLLRTSQLHSVKKKSVSTSMRSDCSSDLSGIVRGSTHADIGDDLRH